LKIQQIDLASIGATIIETSTQQQSPWPAGPGGNESKAGHENPRQGGRFLRAEGIVAAGDLLVGDAGNGGTIINDNTILASGNTATAGAGVSVTRGVFDLAAGSHLTLNGAVGASQTVAFLGAGATLELGDAALFRGILADHCHRRISICSIRR
jgi:hypothetical protein